MSFVGDASGGLDSSVMRWERYSGEAWRSLLRPSGLTLMFATDSGANLAASAFSISVWRKAEAPAPVTPTRTLPPPKSATNTPTMAKRDAGFLNFMYAARLGTGKDTAVISSPGSSAVSYRPLKNLSASILRLLVVTVAPRPSTAAG